MVYLFVGLAIMLTLAAPILDLRLGQTDSSQSPTSSTLRRSYDLLAEGFGPGFNGPFVLAVNLEGATLSPEKVVEQLSAALTAEPDVAEIARVAVGPDGKAAVIQVIPKSAPQDKETSELIARLRSSVLPDAVAVTGGTVYVSVTVLLIVCHFSSVVLSGFRFCC